jgi:acetate kinase
MKILVINSGSSSIKFQLLNMTTEELLCKGLIERIGLDNSIFTYQTKGGVKIKRTLEIKNHVVGLENAMSMITDEKVGVIKSIDEIKAVGHRIVHGAEKVLDSVNLSDDNVKIVEECIPLAPLHNPANLMGVAAMKKLLPHVIHVGVFDTAFHSTMPKESYIYPIPYEMYEKYGIRRFGFHGTSHKFVAMKAAEKLGIPFEKFNGITVHLGNGSSLTAVKNGKSVDTTLGYGTMCGVPMGTRAGDIDPAIILHMIDNLNMSTKEVNDILYKKSGLLGLSGVSSDMRDIEEEIEKGNERAKVAIDVFVHQVAKNILALASNLEKIDAIIFTAGIGENGYEVRELICERLKVFGLEIDKEKNKVRGEYRIISKENSLAKIMVVPTNEELMIAIDTKRIYNELK